MLTVVLCCKSGDKQTLSIISMGMHVHHSVASVSMLTALYMLQAWRQAYTKHNPHGHEYASLWSIHSCSCANAYACAPLYGVTLCDIRYHAEYASCSHRDKLMSNIFCMGMNVHSSVIKGIVLTAIYMVQM